MANQNKIEAVIWDMGGVLLQTYDQLPRLNLADRLGTTEEELYDAVFNSKTAHQATRGEISEEAHWKWVLSHFHLQDDELPRFRDMFWGGDDLDIELIAYIESLRPRYRTALLSNAWSGARATMTRRYRMLQAFDESIFSAEIGLAKPDAAIYEYMLDKLALPAEKTVFIDDVAENIEAAKALGMQGIVFRSRQQAQEDLASLGITAS
jgi:epoxide hydrolase-like predicted phosphatase